jgi:hypothetical protein
VKVIRVTPVIVAERIEPLLSCWRDVLGYDLVSSTSDAGGLGHALLSRDGTWVRLMSRRSLAAEAPRLYDEGPPSSVVSVDVASLDEVLRKLPAAGLIAPPRINVAGQREAIFRDAAGHVVLFSERGASLRPGP